MLETKNQKLLGRRDDKLTLNEHEDRNIHDTRIYI